MFLIGISGGTGSGKSTLAKELLKHYQKKHIAIINQDSYYKNFEKLNFQERCLINYDNPKSIDFKLLVDNLYNLKNYQKVKEPVYSYKTHKRLKKNRIILPKKIIILEGLHIFYNESVFNLIDFGIYLKVGKKIRLKRRINRDSIHRKRSKNEVRDRFLSMCQPMHLKYTKPFMKKADLTLDAFDIDEKKIINLISKKINVVINKKSIFK
tara:strand:- start:357 stop:986 length:630 start_codon:yes stop_codon:yes gene_type:complete